MEEIWKDIPRFEGYQASNLGRIRTHNKITYTEHHGERHWKDRIMRFKPSQKKSSHKQGDGYRITLWKEGKPNDFLVARLIATTFLEDLIDTEMTVNHKNGNRLDNRVENLEWITRGENITYGFDNDQYKSICTKCKLIGNGETYEFRSMAMACRFLKRNKGYINEVLRRRGKIRDVHGIEYNFEIIENV